MIKVTVEYLVDEKELEKELEIIRRAYTEALKNKKNDWCRNYSEYFAYWGKIWHKSENHQTSKFGNKHIIKLQHYKQQRSRRNENCLLIFLKGIKLWVL